MTWTDDIREQFDLPTETEQLLLAAEQAQERWLEIKERLDTEGIVIPGRYANTPRVNPLVAAEARARESFLRALRALDLPEAT
jgi:thymidylate kinase